MLMRYYSSSVLEQLCLKLERDTSLKIPADNPENIQKLLLYTAGKYLLEKNNENSLSIGEAGWSIRLEYYFGFVTASAANRQPIIQSIKPINPQTPLCEVEWNDRATCSLLDQIIGQIIEAAVNTMPRQNNDLISYFCLGYQQPANMPTEVLSILPATKVSPAQELASFITLNLLDKLEAISNTDRREYNLDILIIQLTTNRHIKRLQDLSDAHPWHKRTRNIVTKLVPRQQLGKPAAPLTISSRSGSSSSSSPSLRSSTPPSQMERTADFQKLLDEALQVFEPPVAMPPPTPVLPSASPPRPQVRILEQIPKEYLCPISALVMEDPVDALNGRTYDRHSIENLMLRNPQSPLGNGLIPNPVLKLSIKNWLQRHDPWHTRYLMDENSQL